MQKAHKLKATSAQVAGSAHVRWLNPNGLIPTWDKAKELTRTHSTGPDELVVIYRRAWVEADKKSIIWRQEMTSDGDVEGDWPGARKEGYDLLIVPAHLVPEDKSSELITAVIATINRGGEGPVSDGGPR